MRSLGKMFGSFTIGIFLGASFHALFSQKSNALEAPFQQFQEQAKQSLVQAENLYASNIREMAYPHYWRAFQETSFVLYLRPDPVFETQKITLGKKLFLWACQQQNAVLAQYLLEELQLLELFQEQDRFDFENQLLQLRAPKTKKNQDVDPLPHPIGTSLSSPVSSHLPPSSEPASTTENTPIEEENSISQSLLCYQQGIEKSAQSDWEGAIECFTKAIEFDPQDALSFSYRALAKNALGATDEAFLDYTRAIELDSNQPVAYKGRAEIFWTRGEWENAQKDYQQALQLYPQDAWVQERLQQLLKKITVSSPLPPNQEVPPIPPQPLKLPDAQQYFEQGCLHAKAGETNLALQAFTNAIQADSQYAEAYNERAVLHYQKKSFKEALFDLHQAIKLSPQVVKYYNNRGAVKIAMKDWKGALKDIEASIRLDPRFSAAYQNRADIKKQFQDWDGAIFDQTLSHLLDGNQYREQKEWDRALEAYTQGYRLNAQYTKSFQNQYYIEILYYRGLIFVEKNELDLAKSDFKEYLRYTQQNKKSETQKRQKWILSQFPDILR